jgi:3-dehydroquinate dehydratase/shikimate dehydrogenase
VMSGTLVCETVTAESMAELRAGRDRALTADLVELRLDGVRDLDIAGALEGRTRPVIATLRAAREGGRFDGSEEERLGLLAEAMRLGAEYVDVEWRADRRGLPDRAATRVILSHHDFDGVPGDLVARVRAMRSDAGTPGASGTIVKVAVKANRLSDCLTLRDAMRGIDGETVTIAMGAAGQLTRLFPSLFGSRWTYGGTAAPGQVSVRDLIDTYRVRQASDRTAIYAITGAPLDHSASPLMHNRALATAGIDAVYLPLPTDDADEFDTVARAIGVAGASVTTPLKQALFARARTADDLSHHAGATNTLRRAGDEWEARNFDVAGFLAPLDRLSVSLRDQRVAVLGAGGAARTAAWALRARGARVEVAARRAGEADRLAASLGVRAVSWPPAPGWDLLVNATTAGMWPNTTLSPLDRDRVAGRAVYDLVYNPRETTLLRWARAAGAQCIGGGDMLVEQACGQFTWWTGVDAPRDVMADALTEFLNGTGTGR